MKKITLALLIGILGFTFGNLNAQADMKPELSAVVGYQFGGHMNFYEGEFRIDNGMNYGFMANVAVRPDQRIEIAYSFMPTTFRFTAEPFAGPNYDSWEGDGTLHYFLIGSHSEYNTGGALTLFGGGSIGAAWMVVDKAHYTSGLPGTFDVENVARFAFGFTGGLKIALSEKVGIRLQGRLLMPTYFAGVGFYISPGGSGLSLNSGAVLFQGDFQGGLYIML